MVEKTAEIGDEIKKQGILFALLSDLIYDKNRSSTTICHKTFCQERRMV